MSTTLATTVKTGSWGTVTALRRSPSDIVVGSRPVPSDDLELLDVAARVVASKGAQCLAEPAVALLELHALGVGIGAAGGGGADQARGRREQLRVRPPVVIDLEVRSLLRGEGGLIGVAGL